MAALAAEAPDLAARWRAALARDETGERFDRGVAASWATRSHRMFHRPLRGRLRHPRRVPCSEPRNTPHQDAVFPAFRQVPAQVRLNNSLLRLLLPPGKPHMRRIHP